MRSPVRQGVPTRLLVPLLAILLSVVLLPGTASAASSGPPLTVPLDELQRAVSCDGGALAGRRTVLLIHGTGATPEEAWSWNYQRALPVAGYGVCTVRLPERALADFTLSAAYAVHAAREAYRVSGRRIAVLGHSQGGLMTAWIAKFWPDVARHSTDVLSLAGPMHGTALANTLCAAGACAPISWQMRMGSHVTNAASNAPVPTSTSFTSIGSLDDEVVFPQPVASHLAGARNVMVQDLCPGRVVDHGLLLSDAVTYRLVLDALAHDGPADPARIPPDVCNEQTMPGVDPLGAALFAPTVVSLGVGLLNAGEWTTSEAQVPAYAAPYSD